MMRERERERERERGGRGEDEGEDEGEGAPSLLQARQYGVSFLSPVRTLLLSSVHTKPCVMILH